MQPISEVVGWSCVDHLLPLPRDVVSSVKCSKERDLLYGSAIELAICSATTTLPTTTLPCW